MNDSRTILEIADEARKGALTARLRGVDDLPDGHLWDGIAVITARDIEEAFDEEVELDYAHRAELETPADLRIDIICPNCAQTLPDVAAKIVAVMTKEGSGPTKVKVKLEGKAQVHVCGQQALPKPQPPEVEGQEPAFDDLEDDEGEGAE